MVLGCKKAGNHWVKGYLVRLVCRRMYTGKGMIMQMFE